MHRYSEAEREAIRKRLAVLMPRMRWTQRMVAEKLELSAATYVSDFLRGVRSMGDERLEKLSHLLDEAELTLTEIAMSSGEYDPVAPSTAELLALGEEAALKDPSAVTQIMELLRWAKRNEEDSRHKREQVEQIRKRLKELAG